MNMATTLSGMVIAGIVAGCIAGVCLLGLAVKLIISAVNRKSNRDRMKDPLFSRLVESRSVETNEDPPAHLASHTAAAEAESEIESAPPIPVDNVSHTTDSYTDVRIEQEGSIHGDEEDIVLTTFVGINNGNNAQESRRDFVEDSGAALHTLGTATGTAVKQDAMEDDERGNEDAAPGGDNNDDRASRTTDSDTDMALEQELATGELNNPRQSSYYGGSHDNKVTTTDDTIEDDRVSRTTDSDTDLVIEQEIATGGIIESIPTSKFISNHDNEVATTEDNVVNDDEASRTTDSVYDMRLELEIGANETASTRPASYNFGRQDDAEETDDEEVIEFGDDVSYTTDSDTDTKVKLETTLDKQRPKTDVVDSLFDNEFDLGNSTGDQPTEPPEITTEDRDVAGLENFSYSKQPHGESDNFELRGGFQSEQPPILTTPL